MYCKTAQEYIQIRNQKNHEKRARCTDQRLCAGLVPSLCRGASLCACVVCEYRRDISLLAGINEMRCSIYRKVYEVPIEFKVKNLF